MPEAKVAAIVLAAGGSTRFGQAKQLLLWEGHHLVTHAADIAWAAGLHPVVVVLGAQADRIRASLGDRPLKIMHNYRWQEGLSTSLHIGLAALPSEVEAAIFMPIDQPLITPRFLRAMVKRWRATKAGIVVPTTEHGQRGTPVLFSREFFPELAHLSGDIGGRALFKAHADRIVKMPVEDATMLIDVDTPEAYAGLQANVKRQDPAQRLGSVKAILSDMDGVLWRGDTPLPGLPMLFDFIAEQALDYVLITNNSSRTPQQYVDKLARMGTKTTVDHVLNSAQATADYLATRAKSGTRVYAIGGPGVFESLRMHGFQLVDEAPVDYVVMGWDRDLSWTKLAIATQFIRKGAQFISTNPDRTFPMETGLVPGNGAQTIALEAATDVQAVMIGKPFPYLYQQAMARMGAKAEETLIIGDRLDTDILGGQRLGLTSALVLTGIATREELRDSPIHPDMVFDSLSDLIESWRFVQRSR